MSVKPDTPAEDSVRIGPALMPLTRMPRGPRSCERYRTLASSAALAMPMML